MNIFLTTLLPAFVGYLFGSITPSVWLVKAIKKTDLRDHGSGHAGTTNTIRQAGWFAGLIVLIVDLAKGFLPVFLFQIYTQSEMAPLVAGVFAVIGHCWPVFASFRGGMGLATAAGAFFSIDPFSLLAAILILILSIAIIRHRARASVVTAIIITPVFAILGFPANYLWMTFAISVVILFRFIADWNRKYKGL